MNKRTIATGIGILLVVVFVIVLAGKLIQPEVPPEQQPALANETLSPPEQPDTDNLSAPPQENLSQPNIPPPKKNYTLRENESVQLFIGSDTLEKLKKGDLVRVTVVLVADDKDLLENVLASLNESDFIKLGNIGLSYGGFSGMINQAGFEKLQRDKRVSSIEQDETQTPQLFEYDVVEATLEER